ncbi:MAG TPA: ABC transporter ATP-binding protein [Nitrososphaerales archaeon]|nr:ABC transporter ATP-binding protein [Nitrososphaerales archaeon]
MDDKKTRLSTDLDHDLKLGREIVELDETSLGVSRDGIPVTEIKLVEIKQARIEEGIGIARLVVETGDGTVRDVAFFTKKKIRQFRALSNIINNHMVGKDFPPILDEDEKPARYNRASTLRWLLEFMRPYKTKLLFGIAFSVLLAGFNLVPPYLLQILIDSVLISKSPPHGLYIDLTLVLLGSYGIITMLTVLQGYFLNTLGQRVVNNLRGRVYEHAISLPTSFIERMTTGRILSRLTNDVGNTQWLMVWGVPTLTVNILTLIGIGIILFILDAGLAIFVLVPVPFIIYALIRYRKGSFMVYHRNWRRSADVTAMITDTVPAYQVVKSFVREGREAGRLDENLDKLYTAQVDAVKMNLYYWPALGFLTSLATVAIWWVGGNQVIVGGIQLGIVTAFVAYLALFYTPINNLSNIVPFIQQGITSGDRLREIIDAKPEVQTKSDAVSPKDLGGDIVFENVVFGYEPYNPVIKDFNLKIPRGQRVAIVGRSGSGKTSISRLLMRFYDVNSGSVKIGGIDIRDIDLDYLRSKIAYVLQDVVLFDNTVAYNVGYGVPAPNEKEIGPLDVLHSCKAAGIHKEIMALQLAYDTNLGEKGSTLSGGQRQRLSLARAIIKKPDIFILDEATSDLDVQSEREIYRRMLKLADGKTTILVTHNMYEALSVDNAVIMSNGKIIEEGKPKQLLAAGGQFSSMFKEFNGEIPFEIEDDLSKTDLGDVSVKLPSVELSRLQITGSERISEVNYSDGTKTWSNLTPRLPFPLSQPQIIILENQLGEEVVTINDSEQLEEKSREALKKASRANNFILKVDGIDKVVVRGDELEWHVTTDEGQTVVNTRGRRNVVVMNDKVILIDPLDNISEIDLKKIDKKSMKVLNKTV